MGFVVLPVSLPDIRSVYDVWFASFKGQVILDLIYPGTNLDDEGFRKLHTDGTLEFWKGLTMEHTFKCVDTETGRIAGMATWQVYWRERTAEERVKPWIGWLEGEQRERAEAFLGQLWEKREKYIGEKKHVYCHTVAVHPEYQGRGVGKKLMQWGLDVAEQLKVPIYLESTHEGRPLYERLGFTTLKEGVVFKPEVTQLKEAIEAPLMAKMPASAGGMTFAEWVEGGYSKL
ncbi:acyl-CoA N-acyltransferase [Aspergillus ambiguus]|uniref:GNAT family N-acetyltransferase n=1 Tax=Aspergillus ambiguus TaxID=176160 RepID=UPI003CCCB6D6